MLTELRTKGVRTPILVLSGRDHSRHFHQDLGPGLTDFMGTPFRFNDLLDRVRRLLSSAA